MHMPDWFVMIGVTFDRSNLPKPRRGDLAGWERAKVSKSVEPGHWVCGFDLATRVLYSVFYMIFNIRCLVYTIYYILYDTYHIIYNIYYYMCICVGIYMYTNYNMTCIL